MRLFLGLLFVLVTSAANSQELVWTKDAVTGCQFSVEPNFANPSNPYDYHWTGPCEDGKANGVGRVTLSIGDTVLHSFDFVEATGLVMKNGIAQLQPPGLANLARFELTPDDKCNIRSNTPPGFGQGTADGQEHITIRVKVDLQQPLALWATPVVVKLLDMAADFAWRACPLFSEYGTPRKTVFIDAGFYYKDKFLGDATTLSEASCVRDKRERCVVYGAWRAVTPSKWQGPLREQIQQRAFVARNEANLKQTGQVKSGLISQFGIQEWMPNGLSSNPFFFKNKIIAVSASFIKMLSENEALFGAAFEPMFVSGVPTTEFKSPEGVILIMRIVGTTTLTNGLGVEISVPHGEYVGVYKCSQSSLPCPY